MIRSTSSGGGGGFSIAAHTRKLEVDNRISLRYYYRIADSLLRQADIYREEKNVIDLYIMLLRFSSLITETIPKHRDYRTSHTLDKNTFKKKLLNVLTELEALQPDVQIRLMELNRKSRNQFQMQCQAELQDNPFEWPPTRKQNNLKYENRQVSRSFGLQSFDVAPQSPQTSNNFLQPKTIEGQIRKFSLSIPRPKEETLSRHSILGPNGLYGQWQPPRVDRGVQYPSNLDLTPIEISCVEQSNEDESEGEKNTKVSATSESILESVLSLQVEPQPLVKGPSLGTSADLTGTPAQVAIVRQPSPPPVLADVQDLASDASCQAADSVLEHEILRSEAPLEVHISTTMMENFMRLAKSNTEKNLETCGVLAGSLKNRIFFVTSLIIPKQESTSDSCQATNEEEIFDYQDKQSLFTLGWIHTHPTQSCFMSSIDVHTHYSYQIMLPEAIAIVMAPRDSSRKHGIFRLTAPGGMNVVRHCQLRGFHPHDPPGDGSPIYDHCTDVYMNTNLKFDVVDLR